MAPPDPKRPAPPSVPEDSPAQEAVDEAEPTYELPFEEGEVVPLQADDPRPQRVPQFPAGKRRRARRGDGRRDRELAASYEPADAGESSPRFLYVEKGPGAGQLLPVRAGSLVIGRSSSSHLRLTHPSISRRHAELTRHGERFALRDLRSQNGTYVNRARVRGEVEVYCGDELRLGNAVLRLRGAGAPRRPAGAAGRVAPGPAPLRRSLLLGAAGALLLSLLAGALVQAPRPSAPAAREAVLARYRKGDLDAALALARAERLDGLAAQLSRVRELRTTAARQLSAGAPEQALPGLRDALALDAALAQGVGPVAAELRHGLSGAHLARGTRARAEGQAQVAAEAFREALRLDPGNAEARRALAQP